MSKIFFNKRPRRSPIHEGKIFKSDREFRRWLKEEAVCTITFEDHGQDFLRWHIDEGGEVLHCEPFQSQVWNGTIVDINRMKAGKLLRVKTKYGCGLWTFINYRVVKVAMHRTPLPVRS